MLKRGKGETKTDQNINTEDIENGLRARRI
jgi:hypothetical protein